jgi:hypothetical protein
VATRNNRHAAHCQRVVTFGSFSASGGAGANRFHFSGRVDGRKLASDGYTLVAVPSANHLNGKQATVQFTIHR